MVLTCSMCGLNNEEDGEFIYHAKYENIVKTYCQECNKMMYNKNTIDTNIVEDNDLELKDCY